MPPLPRAQPDGYSARSPAVQGPAAAIANGCRIYVATSSPCFGARTNPGVPKARCLAGLLLLAAVLLPAAPAAGQVPAAPTATTISGHNSGFVTGAGQTLTATATPNAPADHTAVYQWYRGVGATGNGGTMITGASSNTYTTANEDRGYRLGVGVLHRRNSDNVDSSETRATTFVGVRPAPISTSAFLARIFVSGGHGSIVPKPNQTMPQVGEIVNYSSIFGTAPTGFDFIGVKPIQRRLGSSGDNWITIPLSNRGFASFHQLVRSDIGYSFRVCEQFVPIAPRIISSELTCNLVAGGAVVSGDVKIRLRVFLEGPLE